MRPFRSLNAGIVMGASTRWLMWGLVLAVGSLLRAPSLSEAAQSFGAHLKGRDEVPPISTGADGFLFATLNDAETALDFVVLSLNLVGGPTVAHLHFGQPGVAGGIVVFLCGGGGKPMCPPAGTGLAGSITASDVMAVPAQSFAAGDFGALVRALRAGDLYVNVHSTSAPAGEIRGQIH